MAGKFVLKRTSDGQYMFNLKASSGEIILTSERYTQKTGAENGIQSVRDNSQEDGNYERKTSSGGDWYFVLKANNYKIICVSEMYSSRYAMENGIESVKKNAPGAVLDDQT